MSSKRVALATATATLSASWILSALPSRDLTERTLPSIAVIVPRMRTLVWACARETNSAIPAQVSATCQDFMNISRWLESIGGDPDLAFEAQTGHRYRPFHAASRL